MGNQTSALTKRASYTNLLRQARAFARNLASAHPSIPLPANLRNLETEVRAYAEWLGQLQIKGLFAVTPAAIPAAAPATAPQTAAKAPTKPVAKPKAMAAGAGVAAAAAAATAPRKRGTGRASSARRAQAAV